MQEKIMEFKYKVRVSSYQRKFSDQINSRSCVFSLSTSREGPFVSPERTYTITVNASNCHNILHLSNSFFLDLNSYASTERFYH